MKAEVKGRWHFEHHNITPQERWYCSECGEYFGSAFRYCPECGAKMSMTEDELHSYISIYESEAVRTCMAEYFEEKGLVEHGEHI